MKFLYLLTESDSDDFFYHLCVEKLTGKNFKPIVRRINGGIREVRRLSRFLLQDIRRTGYVDDCYFLIALDNDRSPIHPHHSMRVELPKQDQGKQCRYCEIEQRVVENLGQDSANWPIKGAIAVPVEMLESWLLLINDEKLSDSDLPLFSKQAQILAHEHYGQTPPAQLKDLTELAKQRLSEPPNKESSEPEFYLHCVEVLEPEKLAERSNSFRQFKEQVDAW